MYLGILLWYNYYFYTNKNNVESFIHIYNDLKFYFIFKFVIIFIFLLIFVWKCLFEIEWTEEYKSEQ